MKTTSLYGSFDSSANITSNLELTPVPDQSNNFILTENFQQIILGNVHLFFSGIIYNHDDLSEAFVEKDMPEADLLLHLFL